MKIKKIIISILATLAIFAGFAPLFVLPQSTQATLPSQNTSLSNYCGYQLMKVITQELNNHPEFSGGQKADTFDFLFLNGYFAATAQQRRLFLQKNVRRYPLLSYVIVIESRLGWFDCNNKIDLPAIKNDGVSQILKKQLDDSLSFWRGVQISTHYNQTRNRQIPLTGSAFTTKRLWNNDQLNLFYTYVRSDLAGNRSGTDFTGGEKSYLSKAENYLIGYDSRSLPEIGGSLMDLIQYALLFYGGPLVRSMGEAEMAGVSLKSVLTPRSCNTEVCDEALAYLSNNEVLGFTRIAPKTAKVTLKYRVGSSIWEPTIDFVPKFTHSTFGSRARLQAAQDLGDLLANIQGDDFFSRYLTREQADRILNNTFIYSPDEWMQAYQSGVTGAFYLPETQSIYLRETYFRFKGSKIDALLGKKSVGGIELYSHEVNHFMARINGEDVCYFFRYGTTNHAYYPLHEAVDQFFAKLMMKKFYGVKNFVGAFGDEVAVIEALANKLEELYPGQGLDILANTFYKDPKGLKGLDDYLYDIPDPRFNNGRPCSVHDYLNSHLHSLNDTIMPGYIENYIKNLQRPPSK